MVSQTQGDGLLATPEQAAEGLWSFFQPIAPASPHHADELLVNLVEHRLREDPLLVGLWAEGIKKTLVFTSRHQAPLDPEFVHQPGKTKAIHEHTNAAHNTGLVDKNFVCSHGDVIGCRGARFFYHGIHRFLVLGLKPANLIIDDARLHWATTGRVDQQNNCLGTRVFKSPFERRSDQLGAGLGPRSNLSLDFHHRGVRRGDIPGRAVLTKAQPGQHN